MQPATSSPTIAYQDLAGVLRSRIVSGDLPIGRRLPSEPDLADLYGVSRSTVREALRILTSEHLLETRRGVTGGTFVSAPTPDAIASSLSIGLGCMAGADELTVEELLEARLHLEVPAARMSAQRASDTNRRRLLEVAALPAREERFTSTSVFHLVVLESTGNRLLPLMTRPIFDVLESRFARNRAFDGFWTRVAHDHRYVARAIADGDPDAAAARMESHLGDLAETYHHIDVRSNAT